MALIGKIRKHFWFVLILLGLALAAFILMDMTSASNMGGAGNLVLGNVAGEKVSYNEFQTMEQSYYGNSGGEVYTKKASIWDFFIERAIVNSEAEELGLHVTQEELMDLQFGAQPSQIIQQNWRNPQTGQMDLATLNQIKSTIENNEEMNPRFRQYWAEQEKHIIKDQLQTKLNNLVSKGIYTPSWMAEISYQEDNTKADFRFVKIPFDNISADGIELTDSDFTNYMNENKHLYEKDEETRVVDLAIFDVVPTAQDSTELRDSIEILKTRFANTENDSLFAMNNSGQMAPVYIQLSDFPESAKGELANLEIGNVSNPFIENNTFSLIKLIDKRLIPDTVRARHILRTADRANSKELAEANAFIDSLENRFNRGVESFDSLAIKNSQDPGSGAKGGLLDDFTQGRMVPEFDKVCFVTGKAGNMYTVESQFGVHLIKLEKQIFSNNDPKYKVATVNLSIIPSEETQNDLFEKVSDMVSENRDAESFAKIAEAEGIEIVTSDPVGRNDFNLASLGAGQESRDIIRWAFDDPTESGDVSPEVYTVTDNVNYYNKQYIVGMLKEIIPAGLPTVSGIKSVINDVVMNEKKARKFVSSLNVSSLEDIAANNNVAVDTATDVSFKGSFVKGLGNEQDVIAAAFNVDNMAISNPIIGKSGVFIIQPLSKLDAPAATNIPLIKKNVAGSTRSQVFKLIDALKDKAEVEDNRFTFF